MAGGAIGTLALDGSNPRGDSVASLGPRAGHDDDLARSHSYSHVQGLHDPSVTFEEYLHFAKISRADIRFEDQERSFNLFRRKTVVDYPVATNETHGHGIAHNEKRAEGQVVDEKAVGGHKSPHGGAPAYSTVSDDEYVTASRAARNATWGAVFYLITTDILGPFSTPWAFYRLGYGPATVLYTVFGACAGYGGFLLWRMFLGLDSDRYPLKTYGDIAFRVYGTIARHSINVTQSVQLLFNVGILIIANGQSLSQITKNSTCFIILCFVWAIAGMILGQIRTLQRLGWLANAAIWMNLFVIFLTMGIVAHSPPNYEAGIASNFVTQGPVQTSAGPPPGIDFSAQVVGLMQAVYSYGGAMLFVEFMSEMKRPWDFWKGMLCAQTFIFLFYLLFGLFVYSYQGQFTVVVAYQGISSYAWQTTANSIGLVSALIAALLYGNIGIKVIYNNVLMDLLKFPPLTTKKGKYIWCGVVPVYWGTAFVVAAAIPQVSNLSGLIAAACILQFSYTFPPFLMLGYRIKKDAIVEGEGFDASTGRTIRHDEGFKRWRRGYMKSWILNTVHIIFFLGSAATAILGIYSAVIGIIKAYAAGAPPSFSCRSPVSTS